MADDDQIPEFLSLPPRDYPSDDDIHTSIQPALDTLFSQFTRTHRSVSPATGSSTSRTLARPRVDVSVNRTPDVDLRALDYPTEYDSHLMCPICHIPFIDPVVLDCDHTFCASCYDEYTHAATSSERSQCPSCRAYVLSSPKKASRLISNMCNDIQVQCPNEDCLTAIARGYIERHIQRDCAEQALHCPDLNCERQTKRKNYVPGQCIHNSHIECDCGAVIELGRGEWLKHKDEDCPNTGVKCEQCGDRIAVRDYLAGSKAHQCRVQDETQKCPGQEYGCSDEIEVENMEVHVKTCPLAKLAPHLARQSRLLQSMTEQLAHSKMRNEALESGLERIDELLMNQIQPKPSNFRIPDFNSDQDHDVEEIERDHIPSAVSVSRHRDLLLPAHVRDLTPSPTFSQSQAVNQQPPYQQFHPSPNSRSNAFGPSHQQIAALHDSLRTSINNLETDVHNLHGNFVELDARLSMQIMNENLRLKEELAHHGAALFSTRAQVQWLLNRERMNMGVGVGPSMMRGRQPSLSQQGPNQQTQPQVSDQQQTSPTAVQSAHAEAREGEASSQPWVYPGANTSTQSSTTTSPKFGASGETHVRRPSIRRPSAGSSQERFKL